MKRKLITAAAIALILTACGSENTEHSETTAAQTTAVSAVQTAASKPKSIKPLSPTKSQSYYQDEVFSVTASLDDLKSLLYYPDIVAKMGVNPEMFAIDITVKVKNISQEEQNFDQSKLELLSGDDVLYIFDSYVEKAENIKSGKTVTLYLKALCTLQQAAEISGMTYVGQPLETGEYFYPDEFADIIDVQSDEDVSSYLYKQYIDRAARTVFDYVLETIDRNSFPFFEDNGKFKLVSIEYEAEDGAIHIFAGGNAEGETCEIVPHKFITFDGEEMMTISSRPVPLNTKSLYISALDDITSLALYDAEAAEYDTAIYDYNRISGNDEPVVDISELAEKLPNLEKLFISSHIEISNSSALSKLSHLKELHIDVTEMTDLSFLSDIKVKKLSLTGVCCPVDELSKL